MIEQESGRSKLFVLLSANVAVAILQFNIASIYSLMAQEFATGVSGLGLASSVFFLGIGISEIPGGILGTRIGPRNAVLTGMVLSSTSIIFSSILYNFSLIIVARFFTGIGVGAAFPPLVILLTSIYRKGSEAQAIGALSLSFNLGGVVGLFGWAVLGELLGWRYSVFISGLLVAVFGILIYKNFPKTESNFESKKLNFSDLRAALFDRSLTLVTILLVGIGAAGALNWNFEVYFLETTLKLSPGLAGLIGGVGPLFAISAPFVGRVYDRRGRAKVWLFASALLLTVGVAITALDTIVAAILASIFVGIGTSIGYTIGLTIAKEAGRALRKEYESIAVGWADSISLLGGFFSPIVFSFVVLEKGYSIGWISGGFFALILAVPFLVRKR